MKGSQRRVLKNHVLWSGTAVDTLPGNGSHRKMLPDGTIVNGSSPSASTDWSFTRLNRRCSAIAVQWQGKINAVSGLASAGGTDDVWFTVPIMLYAIGLPYYDAAGADYEKTHPAVEHLTDWNLNAGAGMQWGGSMLQGLSQDIGSQYALASSNGLAPSGQPRLEPGICWGMADATAGEILPTANDFSTGLCWLGFGVDGTSFSEPGTAPRGAPDASAVDAIWIFAKIIWPTTGTLTYTTPSLTVTGRLRLLGFE